MRRYFAIQFKWTNEDDIFDSIVTDYDDEDPTKDHDIFWFGISEKQIQDHIQTGEPVCNQFVILDYTEIKF